MGTLLTDVKTLLQSDETLASLVAVFEVGQPDVQFVTKRLNGGHISVMSGGVKQIDDLWKEATIMISVSTRRPSVNDSDALNVSICDEVTRVVESNARPGAFSTSVMGKLTGVESEQLEIEDEPTCRVVVHTATYKVFQRGE